MPNHCISCNKPIENENYKYCTKCYYNKFPEKKLQKNIVFKGELIKGKIAETIVQELFLLLGYNVFRYGMENTIPGIMKLLKGVETEVAKQIRKMPDFVIQNPDNNEVYFVEVKFRAKKTFKLENLKGAYPYENAYFIVVSKNNIKCITYNELKEGKYIDPNSNDFYLGNREEFNLDKETISKFCKFVVSFFKEV